MDSGKSVHDLHPAYSLVDLNRAGVGLLEIVTEPDFRSPDEVSAFLKRLTLLLRVLGTNDSTLEDGSIRCVCGGGGRGTCAPLTPACRTRAQV